MYDLRPFLVQDAFKLTSCGRISLTIETAEALVAACHGKSMH
jgi:hypothetical protein